MSDWLALGATVAGTVGVLSGVFLLAGLPVALIVAGVASLIAGVFGLLTEVE